MEHDEIMKRLYAWKDTVKYKDEDGNWVNLATTAADAIKNLIEELEQRKNFPDDF